MFKELILVAAALISEAQGEVPKTEVKLDTPAPSQISWKLDPEVSFYGPGFYGNRTACGQKYTTKIKGVAHRTLPCGTLVSFKYKGRELTLPVIDRGPYVDNRTFDLSGGACAYLRHCFTAPIYYFIHN